MIDNDTRAARAAVAVEAYCARSWTPEAKRTRVIQEDIIDLLSDLRHLCAQRGWDISTALAWSELHFQQERENANNPSTQGGNHAT